MKIFGMPVDAVWQTGEPGMLFMGRINQTNQTMGLPAYHL